MTSIIGSRPNGSYGQYKFPGKRAPAKHGWTRMTTWARAVFRFTFQAMKASRRKKPLTFGGVIIGAHDAWDGQLAIPYIEPTMPLPSAKKAVRTVSHKAGFPVRTISKWYAAIASHVPIGYEDETGFHYGPHPGD
jgi:hypothetical protein